MNELKEEVLGLQARVAEKVSRSDYSSLQAELKQERERREAVQAENAGLLGQLEATQLQVRAARGLR